MQFMVSYKCSGFKRAQMGTNGIN